MVAAPLRTALEPPGLQARIGTLRDEHAAFWATTPAELPAREARAFDPDLPLDDLWQALRNVWTGNSLQMLLDLPVELNPALFA